MNTNRKLFSHLIQERDGVAIARIIPKPASARGLVTGYNMERRFDLLRGERCDCNSNMQGTPACGLTDFSHVSGCEIGLNPATSARFHLVWRTRRRLIPDNSRLSLTARNLL